LHGGEDGGEVVGSAGRKPEVDPDRGVQVGVGRPHDRGHRPAGRHPGDVDPAGINAVLTEDLARDAGDDGRLAPPALLVCTDRRDSTPASGRAPREGISLVTTLSAASAKVRRLAS
jgi:hypothetical protein